MKTDLVATIWPIPQQISGAAFAAKEQPSPFAGGMSVGRLPDFAHPKAVASLLPAQYRFVGPGEVIRLPSIAKGWMFKDAAASIEGCQCGLEAPTIISGPVMLATPTREVHMGEARPKLARRMSDNRMVAVVSSRIPLFIPRINIGQADVSSGVGDKNSSDQHPVCWNSMAHTSSPPGSPTSTSGVARTASLGTHQHDKPRVLPKLKL